MPRQIVEVPTSQVSAGGLGMAMAALSGGVLAGGESPSGEYCVWLEDGGVVIPVIWPPGFRARLDPLELLDADDNVIAQEGQVVIIGGGAVSVDGDEPFALGHASAFVAHTVTCGQ